MECAASKGGERAPRQINKTGHSNNHKNPNDLKWNATGNKQTPKEQDAVD
jgi:hypothetical protein